MWAIWRCCGVAVLRCCGKAVGGQSGLVSGSGCGSGLLVPRQKPGQPQRSHHLRGGVDANGEVALCKPGGPLAHRQLAPGKLPHQRVLPRVLLGPAFHSSQLPNSEREQRTTLREHQPQPGFGAAIELARRHGIVEMENIRDAMGVHQRIKHNNHQLHLDTRNRRWGGVVPRQPSRLFTKYSQRGETKIWNFG